MHNVGKQVSLGLYLESRSPQPQSLGGRFIQCPQELKPQLCQIARISRFNPKGLPIDVAHKAVYGNQAIVDRSKHHFVSVIVVGQIPAVLVFQKLCQQSSVCTLEPPPAFSGSYS